VGLEAFEQFKRLLRGAGAIHDVPHEDEAT
jgi:hypothetical protein